MTYFISVEPTRFKEDGVAGAPLIVRHHWHDTHHYTNIVDIQGPSRLVFSRENPLPDGTRAWIETEGPVIYKEEQ